MLLQALARTRAIMGTGTITAGMKEVPDACELILPTDRLLRTSQIEASYVADAKGFNPFSENHLVHVPPEFAHLPWCETRLEPGKGLILELLRRNDLKRIPRAIERSADAADVANLSFVASGLQVLSEHHHGILHTYARIAFPEYLNAGGDASREQEREYQGADS